MSTPGYLTDAELTTVQGTLQLGNKAAHAFIVMRAAAKEDGVTVTIVPPAGGYRTMALTLAMRANPAKYNVTPGILPSLQSLHMQGIAADIGSGFAWVKRYGHKFGWSFPLAGDPNHAVYDGTIVAGDGERITETEQDMIFVRKGTGNWWVKEAGAAWQELTQTPADLVKKATGMSAPSVSDAELTQLQTLFPNPSSSAGVLPPDLATKTDIDAAARTVIEAIPTAEVNGAAARAAIIK